MQPFIIIRFKLLGLHLQEPMALITNWLIMCTALYLFFRLLRKKQHQVIVFRRFYLLLAISTFFGGLGHLFFQYSGIYGKMPSWIFATLAGIAMSHGMLQFWEDKKSYSFLNNLIWIKAITLLGLSITLQKFVFIAIDSILTYLIYTGYIALHFWRKGQAEMKHFVVGILILLPSSFIFLLNLNVHKFLNRDDLSHLLIVVTIIFFYRSVNRLYPHKKVSIANISESPLVQNNS